MNFSKRVFVFVFRSKAAYQVNGPALTSEMNSLVDFCFYTMDDRNNNSLAISIDIICLHFLLFFHLQKCNISFGRGTSVARRDHGGGLALLESSRGYWYDAEITRTRQWRQRITEDLPDASKMYDWKISSFLSHQKDKKQYKFPISLLKIYFRQFTHL